MRLITLNKTGLNKLRSHHKELKQVDLQDSIKPLTPGEWIILTSGEEFWVGFVNPLIEEKFACVQILQSLKKNETASFSPENFVVHAIEAADKKRKNFLGYTDGCRLFYGSSDGLPGLIIDTFQGTAIIQVNTAGVDKFRDLIKDTVSRLINGKAYLLDNPKYREKEFLPTFENETVPALAIKENGISYHLRPEVLQKVGFYYDHRENRIQLQSLLGRLNKKLNHGIDLFCYAGAWGLNALKANVQNVDFVDQGDFDIEIKNGLEKNNFAGRGHYHRMDVFKFLDQCISQNKQYDLILCDPPAFAKSHLQKDQALEGYSKLHRKVFKIAQSGAVLAFSSCTHYVSHSEFEKNINEAAAKENKKIQLLYCGLQGWDHPISRMDDRSNYIKSYFYLME